MSNQIRLAGQMKVSGHFTLRRLGPDGRCRQQLEFDNLITDMGLDQIFTAPAYAYGYGYPTAACAVGTGNTPPANTDTALASWLASTGGGSNQGTAAYVAGPPAYWKNVLTYRFGTGIAAGNLTEIGIFPTNLTATSLGARALILDGGGAPTTLVVLADEILDVTYERRIYLDTTDTAGTFSVNGVSYNTVQRLFGISAPPQLGNALHNVTDGDAWVLNAFAGALGTVLTQPSGANYRLPYAVQTSAYVNGDHHFDCNWTIDVTNANFGAGGIKAMTFETYMHKFQCSFIDPLTSNGIPKVAGQKLYVNYRFSWDRYTP
jgi:hypothetical protein